MPSLKKIYRLKLFFIEVERWWTYSPKNLFLLFLFSSIILLIKIRIYCLRQFLSFLFQIICFCFFFFILLCLSLRVLETWFVSTHQGEVTIGRMLHVSAKLWVMQIFHQFHFQDSFTWWRNEPIVIWKQCRRKLFSPPENTSEIDIKILSSKDQSNKLAIIYKPSIGRSVTFDIIFY